MSESNVAPACPGCGSIMRNIGGRDYNGLYVDGFGCFDCEGWYVPFETGRVRVESLFETVDRPLGQMARYVN